MSRFAQTLEYIYQMLPMYHKIGTEAYKPGLQNIISICEFLGNPQNNFKSIHIAGTNGKGSVSHMMASVFQTQGYKTGLYTSPHLKSFTERIKINGIECSEEFVIEFVDRLKPLIEKLKPSFFEITTVMAFEYFSKEKVDFAVIETGLGGRLDSTNIITPILSIITNIGYDHMDLLGNTLPEIAFEKAGIIKKNIPVIINEYNNETYSVFIKKAFEESAEIIFTDEIEVEQIYRDFEALELNIWEYNSLVYQNLKLDLLGNYQLKNVKAIIKAKSILEKIGIKISKHSLYQSLSSVKKTTNFKGRWQILNKNPLTICDTGHNEDGIKLVVENFSYYNFNKLIIVLGMAKDKKHEKILKLLPKDAYYIIVQPTTPRAMAKDKLLSLAHEFNLKAETANSVNEGITKATQMAKSQDLIFIGGSNFVVAEIENL